MNKVLGMRERNVKEVYHGAGGLLHDIEIPLAPGDASVPELPIGFFLALQRSKPTRY